jgi:hypothetical protein
MKWIVELEKNVWIAPWAGDPGRTVKKENAEVFEDKLKASQAITYARVFRPFKNAKVVKVEGITCA